MYKKNLETLKYFVGCKHVGNIFFMLSFG